LFIKKWYRNGGQPGLYFDEAVKNGINLENLQLPGGELDPAKMEVVTIRNIVSEQIRTGCPK